MRERRSSKKRDERRLDLGGVASHDDTLARGQTVRLEHHREAELAPPRPRRGRGRATTSNVGGRDAVAAEKLLGENLAPLELGGRPPRAEDPQPARLELVDDAQGQRQLGPDHGQVDAGLAAANSASSMDLLGGDRDAVRDRRDARIARRSSRAR